MSRFTVTILLACVLLGILLWIVLSTVAELANPQPLAVPAEQPAEPEFDPDLPVITTAAELRAWLERQQLDSDLLLGDLQGWKQARGYPPYSDWTAATAAAGTTTETLPEENAALITLAGNGDIEAAAALAERSMRSNPVEALEWWDQAVINGSLYAMVRVSDLLQTLGDPALAGFRSDPVWQQGLAEITAQSPPVLVRSLAWALAAVSLGGYTVVDAEQADRIAGLAAMLDEIQTQTACETAQEYVLDTAAARRAGGGAVFATARPLFAVSVANPATVIPCNLPIIPLVDQSNCLTAPFVGPGERLWQAWFCPSP